MNKISISLLLLVPSLIMGMNDLVNEAKERAKLLEEHIAILTPFAEATTVYTRNVSRWRNIMESETESLAKKGEIADTMRGFNGMINESIAKLSAFYTREYLQGDNFPIFDLSDSIHDNVEHVAHCQNQEQCYCKGIQLTLNQNQEELSKLSKRITKIDKNFFEAVWLKTSRNERVRPKNHIITGDTTTLD